MNVVWKTDEREAESIALLIFVLWRSFHRGWMRCGGVENLFPAEILAETISMTHSDVLYRLGISTCYFYEPLLFQIFVP